MKHAGKGTLSGAVVTVGCLCAVLGATGCNGFPLGKPPPSSYDLPMSSLEELRDPILANAMGFRTLTADCRVMLRSREMQKPAMLAASGRLALDKPGRLYLKAEDGARTYIELISDGRQYLVRMPVLKGMEYGGGYGGTIRRVPNRIHFMPDDLAEAMDMVSVMGVRRQALTAYPRRWDIVGGTPERPALYRPTYSIDSLSIEGEPTGAAKVLTSLLIDRETEEILRLDTFRPDGSLKVRVWYQGWTLVKGGGRSARVPTRLVLWYPPPLENTEITLALSKIKINVPIEDRVFELTQ